MKRLSMILCALWMSYPLAAQSLDAATIVGAWDDGQAPIGWASRFGWRQVDAVALGAWVPGGRSLVSRGSFWLQGYGLGLNLAGPPWTSYLAVGISLPTKLPIQWNGDGYTWQISPSVGALLVNRTGDMVWGGADMEADGKLAWEDQLALGPFHAGGRLLFAGTPSLGGFLAEVDLNFQSNFSILGVSPIDAEGSLLLWTAGLWMHQQWTWSWGSFDIFAAGALFWAPQGSWQVTSFQTSFNLAQLSITTVSSTSGYQFAADPGWLVALKPTLTWDLDPTWSLEASRWIPLVGGWSVTSGSAVLATDSVEKTSAQFQTAVNWLLAGTSINLKARW